MVNDEPGAWLAWPPALRPPRPAGAPDPVNDTRTEQDVKRGRILEYSIRFASTSKVHDAISKLPKQTWIAALDADGDVREGGDVAEITALMDLAGWPTGMRLIVRRERPHPGAQPSLSERPTGDATGSSQPTPRSGSWRFWRPATAPGSRTASATRLRPGTIPLPDFAINTAWAKLTLTPGLVKAEPNALRHPLCTWRPNRPPASDDEGSESH